MRNGNKVIGYALAAAAATLFLSAPMASVAADQGGSTGKCYGVNACKGQSACKTAHSSCKGMNACKGQGFLMKTKSECDKLGGKFEGK